MTYHIEFTEHLEKKIYRMEKWMMRLQRELQFLKAVHDMNTQRMENKTIKVEQIDMFRG